MAAMVITSLSVAGFDTVFPEVKGNELIAFLFVVAYGVWRDTKEERKAERLADKAERLADKAEIKTQRMEDKEERSQDRAEMYLVMVDNFRSMMAVAIVSAGSSIIYTTYAVNH